MEQKSGVILYPNFCSSLEWNLDRFYPKTYIPKYMSLYHFFAKSLCRCSFNKTRVVSSPPNPLTLVEGERVRGLGVVGHPSLEKTLPSGIQPVAFCLYIVFAKYIFMNLYKTHPLPQLVPRESWQPKELIH